jgi:DNA-directed RNA polymerase specialized sigma24 family protein
MLTQTTNALTLEEALQHTANLLHSIAIQYGAEFEDLYQDAAVFLLERPEKLADMRSIPNVKCFLRSWARNILYTRYHHSCPVVSLDEPLDDDETLADMLAAPPDQADSDTTEQDRKTAALYAALRRLPLDEQQYMREVYALNAYQPAIYPPYPPEKNRLRTAVKSSVWRHIHNDAQLASEVLR